MINRSYAKILVSDVAPDPKANTLWMDLATSEDGSTIRFWDGIIWKSFNAALDSDISLKANVAAPSFTDIPSYVDIAAADADAALLVGKVYMISATGALMIKLAA